MKRILVAGGSGFLGSHLCERLIQNGDAVICLDNEVTGSWKNVEHLVDHEHFSTLIHDISEPLSASQKELGQLDQIYHLASPASPIDFEPLSIEIMKANAWGAQNLLHLAREKGAQFLLASTSEVYGDPLVHPQDETYWGNVNPIGVRAVYDESKRFAEAYTTAYCKRHDLTYGIIRIFNTFGPRMRLNDGRVVTNFICQALRHEPLTLYGNGSQTRSFCYVDDLIEGMIRVANGQHCRPINIGAPNEMSMRELAQTIIRLTDSKSTISERPLPENDPKLRRPDTALAEELFGWRPEVPVEAGLQRTIDFIRGQLHDSN